MALYPAAVKRLIPPGPHDPRIKARVVILHVDAGNADSLYHWFSGPSGGVESHFHVKKSGVVEQYRDTDWQADANTDANDFAISIETQGFEAGEWTPAQLAAIKALILWCHEAHDIPLVRCTAWDGAGIGYHTLFPGRWDKRGATCPGPERKLQFNQIISPWLAEATTTPKDWFDMATAADLRAAVKAELSDPDFLREVARFVVSGYAWNDSEGKSLVLAGHLSQQEALARVAIKAASEDLTPEQVKQAVAEALSTDYSVTLTPKGA